MGILKWIGGIIGVLIVISLLLVSSVFTFVDNHEGAYMFDSRTGETKALITEFNGKVVPRQGYIFNLPIIQNVHTIDLRPIQLCIEAKSGNFDRVMNCKLVSFDFNGYRKFISWHGRQSYTTLELEKILMAYAYDEYEKENYTFMLIHKDPNGDVNEVTKTVLNPDNIDDVDNSITITE